MNLTEIIEVNRKRQSEKKQKQTQNQNQLERQKNLWWLTSKNTAYWFI